MHPIYLSILLFVTSTATAEVDCRTACHSCHLKEQPPEMLEIYCAMCQECKERRKDRLKMKMKLAKKSTVTTRTTATESFLEMFNRNNGIDNDAPPQSMEFGDIGLAELMTTEDVPEGCPTSAQCSDDEAPPTTIIDTTTTTTTTTTKKPCPPVKICKKKTTLLSPPSPSPPPPPLPLFLPSPPYIHPAAPPPQSCAYQSQVCPPPPMPMFSMQHYMAPPPQWPMQPVVPLNLPPPFPAPNALAGHPLTAAPPSAEPGQLILSERGKKTTDGKYLYMYVGLPKNSLRTEG